VKKKDKREAKKRSKKRGEEGLISTGVLIMREGTSGKKEGLARG